MWFKPKGWDTLSEADQAWLKEAKSLNKVEKLLACAKDNKPTLVSFLLKTNSFSRVNFYDSAMTAVTHRSAEALSVLLTDIKGFDFSINSSADDQQGARNLFHAVAPDDLQTWDVLWTANKSGEYGRLDDQEIINMLSPEMSDDFFRYYLDSADPSQTWVFRTCVEKTGLQSTEKLKFILSWAEKFSASQGVLNGALASATEAGDAEKVVLLLKKKADPNYSGYVSFLHAVEKDRQEIVDLLLPRINLETYGEFLLGEMRKKGINPAKINWLEKTIDQACAATRLKKNQENFTLVDADTLSEIKQLPAGMKLTTLFNFKSRQQILIVEKTGEKESLSMTVKDFAEIGGQDYLETMRLKLVELGGKADGISRLPKMKLSPD